MARYLILEFEHDDELGLFPDDLENMLKWNSKPPFKVKVVGEGKRRWLDHVDDLYEYYFETVPIEGFEYKWPD